VGIASLYRQIGALDEAVRVIDAVRAEAADAPGAALVAAQARADRAKDTDRDDAVTIALGLPTTADDKPAAIALAAEVLVALGDADRALAVVDAALKDRPDAIDLLLARAQVLHAGGDAAAGRALLADAVKARPGSAALRYALASFEDEIGDSAAAAADAEAIIEARADHVPALNLAGFALAKIGKHLDRAERYLTRARELSPGDPSILDSWGWLLYQLGRLDEAAAALTHASHIAPNQTEILEHLAKVQAVIALQPR
jgi:predicted Zn-dependent protease